MATRTPTIPDILLDRRADIYTEDPATGAFTVLDESDLPVRLAIIGAKGANSAAERAEMVAMRRLVWGPDYAMPTRAQVAIDSERWNPVLGSFTAPLWPPSGEVIYRGCDLIRAE